MIGNQTISKAERSPTAGNASFSGDMSSRIQWNDTALPSIGTNRHNSRTKKSTASSIGTDHFRVEAQKQIGRGRNPVSLSNSLTTNGYVQ